MAANYPAESMHQKSDGDFIAGNKRDKKAMAGTSTGSGVGSVPRRSGRKGRKVGARRAA